MKTSEQALQQIERTLRKTIEKFPATEEATVMTDIHLRVTQETGELTVYNDDDVEITRSVIELTTRTMISTMKSHQHCGKASKSTSRTSSRCRS